MDIPIRGYIGAYIWFRFRRFCDFFMMHINCFVNRRSNVWNVVYDWVLCLSASKHQYSYPLKKYLFLKELRLFQGKVILINLIVKSVLWLELLSTLKFRYAGCSVLKFMNEISLLFPDLEVYSNISWNFALRK